MPLSLLMAASTISAASSEDLLPLNLAPYSVQNLSSSRFCSASRNGQPHGRLGLISQVGIFLACMKGNSPLSASLKWE